MVGMKMTRRTAALGAVATLAAPSILRAQDAPIKIGVLTPLTGVGSFDGPRMLKAIQAAVAEVNAAGGVMGRQVTIIVEDDQTNPEVGVRAARKLIDFDKVSALIGSASSAVTTATAPLCWEGKVVVMTEAGADSVTRLPHQGYLFRTQPNNFLQAGMAGQFIAANGGKRVYALSVQAPFTPPTQQRLKTMLPDHGAALVGSLVYEQGKTSYRSEVDQALQTDPDYMYLGGYTPDVSIVLGDLYRAGYSGQRITQAYALTADAARTLPKEVTEGCYTVDPSADVSSPAYQKAIKLVGVPAPDSVQTQAVDWVALLVLAMARAKSTDGTAIRDAMRRIAQGDGTKVYSAIDGLGLLAKGQEINYEGGSGPCDFTDIGDIVTCKFRFNIVKDGAINFLKVL